MGREVRSAGPSRTPMILTCPDCATSYFVADAAIGPEGRKVRCKSCGHIWRAQSEEPLELTPADAAPVPSTPAAGFGKREETSEAEALSAPELPRAYRTRVEQQRRFRRAAVAGAVWAGIAGVFVALIGAAWLFRVDVVTLYPRAAAAYAAVGMPVNPVGLEFEATTARPAPSNPDMVLVSGAVRNIRDRSITPPPVRVALLDADGAEIRHRVTPIPARSIRPGAVAGFAVLIPDPGSRAADVGFAFAELARVAPRPTPRSETDAEAPAQEAAAPADTGETRFAEAVTPPPPSALRGSLDLGPGPSSEGVASELTPVDAVPISGATSEGLDSATH